MCAVSVARRLAEVWGSRRRPNVGYEGRLPPNPSLMLWSGCNLGVRIKFPLPSHKLQQIELSTLPFLVLQIITFSLFKELQSHNYIFSFSSFFDLSASSLQSQPLMNCTTSPSSYSFCQCGEIGSSLSDTLSRLPSRYSQLLGPTVARFSGQRKSKHGYCISCIGPAPAD